MARKVKFQDTGEIGMSNVGYRAANGKYYSSEAAYNKYAKNKEYREKCIALMYEVLGYSNKMIIPTYYYKTLKDFEGVGYEALYLTMKNKNPDVQWAIRNKDFNGETAKVMYIMAIYKNGVMDEYKKLIAEEKHQKIMSEKVDDISDEFSLEINNNTKKKKDISRFVED